MPCIEVLISNGGKGFDCPVCEEFYVMPKRVYIKTQLWFNYGVCKQTKFRMVHFKALNWRIKAKFGQFGA